MADPFTWRWREGADRTPGPCALIDIDGVLADGTHRQHHMAKTPKDFDAFFDAAAGDSPIAETAVLLRLLDPDVKRVLVTGRPFRIRKETLAWLDEHGFRWDLVVFRGDKDRRRTNAFKKGELGRLKEAGFLPVLAFDDEPGNVAMYREEGVPCLYVHSGYYD